MQTPFNFDTILSFFYDSKNLYYYKESKKLSSILDFVEISLKNKTFADVIDTVDDKGNSCLHYAFKHQLFEYAILLLENKANPFLKNDSGKNCFQISNYSFNEKLFKHFSKKILNNDIVISNEKIKLLSQFNSNFSIYLIGENNKPHLNSSDNYTSSFRKAFNFIKQNNYIIDDFFYNNFIENKTIYSLYYSIPLFLEKNNDNKTILKMLSNLNYQASVERILSTDKENVNKNTKIQNNKTLFFYKTYVLLFNAINYNILLENEQQELNIALLNILKTIKKIPLILQNYQIKTTIKNIYFLSQKFLDEQNIYLLNTTPELNQIFLEDIKNNNQIKKITI